MTTKSLASEIKDNVFTYDVRSHEFGLIDEKITTVWVDGYEVLHSYNDFPSRIRTYFSEKKICEFHQRGVLHRIEGPAYNVSNVFSGDILEEQYWLDGNQVDKDYFRIYVRNLKIKEIL